MICYFLLSFRDKLTLELAHILNIMLGLRIIRPVFQNFLNMNFKSLFEVLRSRCSAHLTSFLGRNLINQKANLLRLITDPYLGSFLFTRDIHGRISFLFFYCRICIVRLIEQLLFFNLIFGFFVFKRSVIIVGILVKLRK